MKNTARLSSNTSQILLQQDGTKAAENESKKNFISNSRGPKKLKNNLDLNNSSLLVHNS